jgi:hypothetical protein
VADVIYGYAPEVIAAVMETAPPAVRRLLDNGVVLGQTDTRGTFEGWLVEKWLREIRSDSFRETAEFEYLRAQWEREG